MIEFQTTAELLQHYAEVRERIASWRPKTIQIREEQLAPEPIPVVVMPAPLPPMPVQSVAPIPAREILRRIRDAVCRDYNVTPEQLMSDSRRACLVRPRRIVWYLVHKLMGLSIARVGRLHNRDASTANTGIHAIERLIEADPVLAVQLAYLEQELRG